MTKVIKTDYFNYCNIYGLKPLLPSVGYGLYLKCLLKVSHSEMRSDQERQNTGSMTWKSVFLSWLSDPSLLPGFHEKSSFTQPCPLSSYFCLEPPDHGLNLLILWAKEISPPLNSGCQLFCLSYSKVIKTKFATRSVDVGKAVPMWLRRL